MKKRGIILIVILVVCSMFVSAQDFDVSIDMPSSVNVNEEFTVNIYLDVLDAVNNGLFIAATVPEEIQILNAQPDNGLIIDDVIIWTLDPFDLRLWFTAIASSSGQYSVDVKVGTYDNMAYDEVGIDSVIIVGGEDVWSLVDLNRDGVISTAELLDAINRWIDGKIDTNIILEAINIWINPPAYCGDTNCNNDETCETCPQDCEDCPVIICGDNNCEGTESCFSCPNDCKCMGDGTCGGMCFQDNQYCMNGECVMIDFCQGYDPSLCPPENQRSGPDGCYCEYY